MHLDFKKLVGNVWGRLIPRREIPTMPAACPRDHAIRTLFDYLALVEWRYELKDGRTESFQIKRAHMYEEKPDDNIDAKFPSLVIDAGRGSTSEVEPALGPPIVWEESFGNGICIVELGMYSETFRLEVWTSSSVKRRAILAGLDWAFAPTGDFAGMVLSLPDYYDQWAWFQLMGTQRFDDVQRESRRRYAVCEVELWMPTVMQVPMGPYSPRYLVRVDEPDDWGVR